MNDMAEYALVGAGMILLMIGLFFVYLFVCVIMGIVIEFVLGLMGHEVSDWYWTGVGLVALIGAVITPRASSKSD